MGLGVPLAMITGWFLAQFINADPQANSLKSSLEAKALNQVRRDQRLAQLARANPRDLHWRLLLAREKFQENDLEAANRELITLQALWPNHPEVQDLKLLLDVGTERQASALKQALKRFNQQPNGQRLTFGLRLADLQRLTQKDDAAIATYQVIAAETPNDIRPLLALALLYRDKGQIQQSQQLLVSVRNRVSISKKDKLALDQLAVRWALEAARKTEVSETELQATEFGQRVKEQVGETQEP